MSQPFKFRYVNELTGAFVLAALALVLLGILLAGRAQQWFVPAYTITLEFPEEGAFGLQRGAEVRILGALVGTVRAIGVNEEGHMWGEASVKGDFIRFVRRDSKAVAKKKFGVAGDTYIDILRGSGPAFGDDPIELPCIKDTEIVETLQQVADQIRNAVLPTIEQARKALESYTALADNLRDPHGPLQGSLREAEMLVQSLNRGEGAVGRLLADPAVAEDTARLVAETRAAVERLQAILDDLKQTSAQLPAVAATAGREVADLPGAVAQARESLRQTQRLIEALQRNWLIRDHVAPDDATERLDPSTLSAGEGDAP